MFVMLCNECRVYQEVRVLFLVKHSINGDDAVGLGRRTDIHYSRGGMDVQKCGRAHTLGRSWPSPTHSPGASCPTCRIHGPHLE